MMCTLYSSDMIWFVFLFQSSSSFSRCWWSLHLNLFVSELLLMATQIQYTHEYIVDRYNGNFAQAAFIFCFVLNRKWSILLHYIRLVSFEHFKSLVLYLCRKKNSVVNFLLIGYGFYSNWNNKSFLHVQFQKTSLST